VPSSRLGRCCVALLLVLANTGIFAWLKFFRDVPQPPFATEADWFKYGSFGGEATTGLPYWIWLEMPKIFPDLLPGPGGYTSLGVIWERGEEMPVGFAKRTLGFARVTENCALCHTTTYRLSADQAPTVVVGAPAHALNAQKLIHFLSAAAADPRFNADHFLAAIEKDTALSLFDRLSYRFLIIPLTRSALLQQGREFAWMENPSRPAWGLGRDDAFNLPKYNVAFLPVDGSVGQARFGDLWRLDQRARPGLWFNWGGESPAVRTVLVDSSIGFGPLPGPAYEEKLARLGRFLGDLAPPPWPYASGPYAVDRARAQAGRQVYEKECADCHEPGGARFARTVPLAEIGTDPNRADTWSQASADAVNRTITLEGYLRPLLAKRDGYLSGPLDGLWLRAPYLHNGSVPNLRELLEPPERRSAFFFTGYDVLDPVNVGFVATGPQAEQAGFRLDTRERGNGNAGHVYGVALAAADKASLIEYLKTL
jgi:mono/diheme cytochrome c family protein